MFFVADEVLAATSDVFGEPGCPSPHQWNGDAVPGEMQVSVVSGLTQRLVYYACSLYTGQLESGDGYADLKPAISICLLSSSLFAESQVPHRRFRMCDPEFDE